MYLLTVYIKLFTVVILYVLHIFIIIFQNLGTKWYFCRTIKYLILKLHLMYMIYFVC